MTWQLQEAKNKFSEVIETTLKSGPQIISRRGKNTAVLISYADYQRYNAPKTTFKTLAQQFAGLEISETIRGKQDRATPWTVEELL